MRTFLTADPHFNHNRGEGPPIRGRPWATVKEHDAKLKKAWNATVGPEDRVFILGDVSYTDPTELLHELNGQLFLVPGNHDYQWESVFKREGVTVLPLLHLMKLPDGTNEGVTVALCHYPLMSWPAAQKGSFHFFAHMHENLVHWGRAMDVCVCADSNWAPWD